jgi:hypothetical protein
LPSFTTPAAVVRAVGGLDLLNERISRWKIENS